MASVRKIKENHEVPTTELVEVIVTKKGDGRISNGNHIPEFGDEFYDYGERFTVTADIAAAQEALGNVMLASDFEKLNAAPKAVVKPVEAPKGI